MFLFDLTEKFVKDFAAPEIYNRGYKYYKDDMVSELDYDPENDCIKADVEGRYGDYEVEIEIDEDDDIFADCTCPYEGYPCKHIVAVLLTFIKDKGKYIATVQQKEQQIKNLKDKIKTLPKEQLVEIIHSSARKYPDFNRDLMVQLGQDREATLKAIFKSIDRALPDIEDEYFDTAGTIKELETILKSVEMASGDMKVRVYWKAVDQILNELNSYGMNDEWFENFAISTLDELIKIISEHKELNKEKREIIAKLMDYYTWGNCGIVDSIYESVHELCSDKEDYLIVIEKLEKYVKKADYKSYYKGLLANLYEKIGDSESKLKTLESHLHYGADYWRLAEYWIKKEDHDKALNIVQEGLEKGEGRKTELYNYMQEHYQKQGDYEKIFQLLKTKIEKSELEYFRRLHIDPTYKLLWSHYKEINYYDGLINIFELHIKHNFIDLDFYKASKKTVRPDDWSAFEKRIIEILEKAIQKQKSPRSSSSWGFSRHINEQDVLAQIYNHKNDIDKLFEAINDNNELIVEYEKKLIPHYPQFYLENYKERIKHLIGLRGRDNYQKAAIYAKTIKHIYQSILKKSAGWELYVRKLLTEHRNLPALQQEFSKL